MSFETTTNILWLHYTNQYRHENNYLSNEWNILTIEFLQSEQLIIINNINSAARFSEKIASDHSTSVRLRSWILEVAVLFHASGSARSCEGSRGGSSLLWHCGHNGCGRAWRPPGRGIPAAPYASLPLPRAPYHISWIVHASVPTPPWCLLR